MVKKNKQTSSKKDSVKSKKNQKQESTDTTVDTSSQEVSKKVDPTKELSLDVQFSEIIAGVQGLQHQLSTLKTHVRTIEKQYARNVYKRM